MICNNASKKLELEKLFVAFRGLLNDFAKVKLVLLNSIFPSVTYIAVSGASFHFIM